MMNVLESLPFFKPELALIIGSFTVLMADLIFKNKKLIGFLSLLVLLITAALAQAPQETLNLFSGFFTLDPFSHFFRYAALGIVAVTILASFSYSPLSPNYRGEYYSLFLFMALGLILMASSTNLLMIFLAIEFVSILSYLLVGFLKTNPKAKEAALKYFLYGSLASGVMLYGMSLLFGITGSLDLFVIGESLAQAHSSFSPIATASLVLILVGIGFKISMAPFHMWAPDIYEAAPTPVTAFLTVGPKALAFAILMRMLSVSFPILYWKWSALIAGLAILTMTIGNIVAISQTNIKRLLAYSSIAQAGYILMGIAVFNVTGLSAVMIYLVAYAFTNLGAFTIVIMASEQLKSDDLQAYAGLGKKSPFLAASLTLFLLSLAGIPPLAGFIGKFLVFSSAIEAGFTKLAIIAAINSAIAAFYYFKIVRVMYLVPAEDNGTIHQPLEARVALYLMLAGTLLVGLFPSQLIHIVTSIVS